ncbi:MAG: DUF1501 domain-containing protein [Actinomycetota bacterium]
MASPKISRRALFTRKPERPAKLTFQPVRGPAGDVLVLIFLRGGMDGLHVVPPHGDADYRAQRPTLAIAEPGKTGGAVDLDGHFGLHPDLAPLKEIYSANQLAIVHASGSPDTTLSHFEAMQTMERGVSDGSTTASGWISRHLASLSNAHSSPIRAIAFSDVLPKSMAGSIGAMAIRSLSEFRLGVPEVWGGGFRSVLSSFYSGDQEPAQAAGKETLELLRSLEKLDASTYKPEGAAKYPDTEMGNRLKQVAQLIKAEVGLEIAEVDLGGWDAHVAQPTLMTGLMKELGQGVHALWSDLGERMNRVTVVAMSEFGRRVNENSGLGTDHGRATAMFLAGAGIRGGKVYGRWPGLKKEQLDRDGNLRVTTDYRDIMGEVLERRLRNPHLAQVFPKYSPTYLNLTT